MFRLVVLILLLAVVSGALAQETVPDAVISQYRFGPQRTGVLDAEPFLTVPQPAWNVPLPRPIRMTPAIADDSVYIGSEAGTLHAIDLASGVERWRFEAGASLVSTPAVTADRLYVGALNGMVYALDRTDGAVVWTVDLGGQVYASPLLVDDVVYLGSTSGQFAALAAADGAPLWQIDAQAPIWSSAAFADGQVFVGTRGGLLIGLMADTGTISGRYVAPGGIDATPAIHEDWIIIGDYTGLVAALDTTDELAVRWQRQLDGAIYASAAVTDTRVYTVTHSGQAVALDRATGDIVWEAAIGGPAYASPVVAGEVVYFVTERGGLLLALDAVSGAPLWEIVTGYQGDWRVSSPVISGDHLLIGSNEPTLGLLAYGR